MKRCAYKRILLKLSGESLLGEQKGGIDPQSCQKIAKTVQELTEFGVQVALVIGGGNLFRGGYSGMQRAPADHIGMLATLMNGIALQQAFEKIHCKSRVLSAIHCDLIAESYSWKKALEYLEQDFVLIFAGGTGNPFFTTDSAAALRALEIEAEVLMKATKVDGIYSKDPFKFPDAEKFDRLSYSQVLAKELQVMDETAVALCRKNQLPIRVIRMDDSSLKAAVFNEPVGTLVTGE